MCLWVIVDGGVERNAVQTCYWLVPWTLAETAVKYNAKLNERSRCRGSALYHQQLDSVLTPGIHHSSPRAANTARTRAKLLTENSNQSMRDCAEPFICSWYLDSNSPDSLGVKVEGPKIPSTRGHDTSHARVVRGRRNEKQKDGKRIKDGNPRVCAWADVALACCKSVRDGKVIGTSKVCWHLVRAQLTVFNVHRHARTNKTDTALGGAGHDHGGIRERVWDWWKCKKNGEGMFELNPNNGRAGKKNSVVPTSATTTYPDTCISSTQIPLSPMKTAIFLATLSTLFLRSQTQNSCTAVAYLGQAAAGGGSCTGQELGDASMRGPGFGACDEVTNGACVLTESSEGDCVIHLYSDSSCATPITGGTTITCGDPFENVNFNSFQRGRERIIWRHEETRGCWGQPGYELGATGATIIFHRESMLAGCDSLHPGIGMAADLREQGASELGKSGNKGIFLKNGTVEILSRKFRKQIVASGVGENRYRLEVGETWEVDSGRDSRQKETWNKPRMISKVTHWCHQDSSIFETVAAQVPPRMATIESRLKMLFRKYSVESVVCPSHRVPNGDREVRARTLTHGPWPKRRVSCVDVGGTPKETRNQVEKKMGTPIDYRPSSIVKAGRRAGEDERKADSTRSQEISKQKKASAENPKAPKSKKKRQRRRALGAGAQEKKTEDGGDSVDETSAGRCVTTPPDLHRSADDPLPPPKNHSSPLLSPPEIQIQVKIWAPTSPSPVPTMRERWKERGRGKGKKGGKEKELTLRPPAPKPQHASGILLLPTGAVPTYEVAPFPLPSLLRFESVVEGGGGPAFETSAETTSTRPRAFYLPDQHHPLPSPSLAWCKSSSLPLPHSPSHVPPSMRERALPSTRTSLPPAPRHRVTESPPPAHADTAHDIAKFARGVVRRLPPPPETELEPESEHEKSPGIDFVFPGARAMVACTELSYAEGDEAEVWTGRRHRGWSSSSSLELGRRVIAIFSSASPKQVSYITLVSTHKRPRDYLGLTKTEPRCSYLGRAGFVGVVVVNETAIQTRVTGPFRVRCCLAVAPG
ncbi:hypothetical protein B0H14DRAFT_3142834 [Mycena olivaceomarginata]|nr:hypothetical protein B0H14DRAFT_3142834 [Mycena olivaceomarginata]